VVTAPVVTDGRGRDWEPDQYNRFAAEREQPFWDLVALVVREGRPAVVDLGCGDGRLTAGLHRTLGAAHTTGVDRSETMIEAARAHAGDGVSFRQGDITRWSDDAGVDVVVANASLQWVPDHRSVLGGWVRSLRAGGQLAVQVPANADHPSHLILAEVAREFLPDPPPDPVAVNVLSPESYAEILDDLGCTAQQVRLQVYAHHLASTDQVVEWVKGTTLNRFTGVVEPDRWEAFVERYRQRLRAELGDRSPYLYPFKRILLWGRLP
jgi:trans-aconitate 2-methyltransferase